VTGRRRCGRAASLRLRKTAQSREGRDPLSSHVATAPMFRNGPGRRSDNRHTAPLGPADRLRRAASIRPQSIAPARKFRRAASRVELFRSRCRLAFRSAELFRRLAALRQDLLEPLFDGQGVVAEVLGPALADGLGFRAFGEHEEGHVSPAARFVEDLAVGRLVVASDRLDGREFVPAGDARDWEPLPVGVLRRRGWR